MNNKSIEIYNKKVNCCGCEACRQSCPHGAIGMVSDEEGFEYPRVDNDKCVNCGICKQVCPTQRTEIKEDIVKTCYVSYWDNDIRIISSSGGLFSVFADEIINKNGIVSGAIFDKDYNVFHKCENKNYEPMRSSKYLQSKIGDNYKEVKEYLEEGKSVLFSGTECQVAGLKSFLNYDYDNLITVGVLCHGTPSPLVWEKYLDSISKNREKTIENISFRNKDEGWKEYNIKICFENGEELKEKHSRNMYINCFLEEICLRPSCYKCQFKKLEREADITIGDSWEIGNYLPEMDDDKGTSVVLIHSEKGQNLWNSINDKIVYKEVEVNKVLPPYADSRNSVKPHINRKKFFRTINNKGFEQATKYLNVTAIDKIRRKLLTIIGRY